MVQVCKGALSCVRHGMAAYSNQEKILSFGLKFSSPPCGGSNPIELAGVFDYLMMLLVL